MSLINPVTEVLSASVASLGGGNEVPEERSTAEGVEVEVGLEEDDTLFDDIELTEVSRRIGDLLRDHWPRILRSVNQSLDLNCTVGISLKLDHSVPVRRAFDVSLSYAVRMKDRASGTVEDPRSPDLFGGCHVGFGPGEEPETPPEEVPGPLLIEGPRHESKFSHCACGPDPDFCEDCYDCRPLPRETPEEFEARTGISREFFPEEETPEDGLRTLVPEEDDRCKDEGPTEPRSKAKRTRRSKKTEEAL